LWGRLRDHRVRRRFRLPLKRNYSRFRRCCWRRPCGSRRVRFRLPLPCVTALSLRCLIITHNYMTAILCCVGSKSKFGLTIQQNYCFPLFFGPCGFRFDCPWFSLGAIPVPNPPLKSTTVESVQPMFLPGFFSFSI